MSVYPRRLTSCVLLAMVAVGASCERGAPVVESPRSTLAVDSLMPRIAYITYSHAGRTDTLWAGSTGALVEDAADVYLDVGGVAEESSIGEFLRIEPAQAVEGEIRWSPYLKKVFFRVGDLGRTGEVTLLLRAGLPRVDAPPLPHDQSWRRRRETGSTVEVTVGGPGVLRYDGRRYSVPDGPVAGTGSTFYVPSDSVLLELAFSRPMDRGRVEGRLRRAFGRARAMEFAWDGPQRLTLTVVFPGPASGSASSWESHPVTLGELADDRGLPNADPRELTFEVGPLPVFHSWSEAEGVQRRAGSPPRLVTHSSRRAVQGDLLLVWHFEEEAGDYWGVSPWLVDLSTGEYRVVGPSQADFEGLSGQWFPGEPRAAVSTPGGILLIDAAGAETGRLLLEDSVNVLEFALNPEDGRIAVLTIPQLFPGDEMPVSVVVFSPTGEPLTRASDIGIMAFQESVAESLWPRWVPDGRLAFLRRKESRWTEGLPQPRHVAFLDPGRSRVEETAVEAETILGSDPLGTLLLDGNRVYHVEGGVGTVSVRGTQGARLLSISPDGRWFAATRGGEPGEVGIVERAGGGWRQVGKGTVLGWSPEGTLYWSGPANQS
jgi:hypothetical protein